MDPTKPTTTTALPVEPILQYFRFDHLPSALQGVSRPFAELAARVMELPRNPERTVALRKLLEAKDAAVRAALTPAPASMPEKPKHFLVLAADYVAARGWAKENDLHGDASGRWNFILNAGMVQGLVGKFRDPNSTTELVKVPGFERRPDLPEVMMELRAAGFEPPLPMATDDRC